MLSGIVNTENIPQILRAISQKRQQGVLEINFGERQVGIAFVQGKVADVVDSAADKVHEMLEMLQGGGLLPENLDIRADSYQELLERLVDFGVDEEIFRRTLKHLVLDRFYRLDLSTGAYYSFKVQIVEDSRDLLPAISIGQLLLDMVSLESDRAAFGRAFPPDAILKTAGHADSFGSEEEAAIYKLIDGKRSVAEIRALSMLSCFHLQEALLGLKEKGLVHASAAAPGEGRPPAAAPEASVPELDIDGIVEALEQSVSESLGGALAVACGPSVEEGQEAVSAEASDGEEYFIESVRPELRVRLGMLSAHLLQANWIPHLIVMLFFLTALLAPLFFWGGVLRRFGF